VPSFASSSLGPHRLAEPGGRRCGQRRRPEQAAAAQTPRRGANRRLRTL